MLRLTEFLLFLAPFAAFVAWRRVAAGGGPSPAMLVLILVGLAVLGAAMAWIAESQSLGRTARYVPARLEDGRVVPGHAAPP